MSYRDNLDGTDTARAFAAEDWHDQYRHAEAELKDACALAVELGIKVRAVTQAAEKLASAAQKLRDQRARLAMARIECEGVVKGLEILKAIGEADAELGAALSSWDAMKEKP